MEIVLIKGKIKLMVMLGALEYGGAEIFVINILKKMDYDRFDVTLCVMQEGAKELHESIPNQVRIVELEIRHGGASYKKHPILAIKRNLGCFLGLRRIARNSCIDIVHAHLPIPSFWANIALGRSRIKLINSYHNTVFPSQSFMKRLKYSDRYARPVCTCCGKESERACLRQGLFPKERSLILENGVDVEVRYSINTTLKPFGANGDSLKIFQVGNMCEQKGYLYTLRALGILKERGLDFHLCIVGDGPMKDQIRDMIQELSLEDNVTIVSGVYGDEKAGIFEKADIYLMPSLWEGLSIAMLEAMVYSKAMILTPVGGAIEVIKDNENGIFVPPKDVELLSQKIALLAENKVLRKKLGQNARETVVNRYNIVDRVHFLQELYIKMVNSNWSYSRGKHNVTHELVDGIDSGETHL